MVFSVIILISWSGFPALAETHTTAQRGRMRKKNERPEYMRVHCVVASISFCCFSYFFFRLSLVLIEIAHPFFLLSISPQTRLVPNDLFISIRHFVCSNSLALFPKGNTLCAAPYPHYVVVMRRRDRVLLCIDVFLWCISATESAPSVPSAPTSRIYSYPHRFVTDVRRMMSPAASYSSRNYVYVPIAGPVQEHQASCCYCGAPYTKLTPACCCRREVYNKAALYILRTVERLRIILRNCIIT